jgi:iron complex outermembrane receptor protein
VLRINLPPDEPEVTDQQVDQTTLRLDWNIGHATQLTATTGYVDCRFLSNVDEDGSTLPIIFAYGPAPRVETVRQFSQELSLATNVGDRLDLVLGALYIGNRVKLFGNAALPLLGIPRGSAWWVNQNRHDSYSGYGQLHYRLTDELRLTAGVRYTTDRKGVDSDRETLGVVFPHDNGEQSWHAMTPRFSLDWRPTEAITLYTTAARGFKSGGFEQFSFPSQSFKPEYIWNYEVGLKASAWQRRLNATLTAFTMNYTDLPTRTVLSLL